MELPALSMMCLSKCWGSSMISWLELGLFVGILKLAPFGVFIIFVVLI
ncbi:hypothetical protein imdm_1519 [gamma proteobacterium IMCC2047]|nr:hypothetical protein imdm_1519 [gamma proteobacterium IMCC2047]